MASGGRKYIPTPQPLQLEDKIYIKLLSEGMKKSQAFRTAYPKHPVVAKYLDETKDREDKARLSLKIAQAARDKVQSKRIQKALVTYQNKMDEFSVESIDTAIDLVKNAKSEKVRADLAIEGIRHKVGTPVVKQQVQEEKTVILMFGDKKPDRTVVEGEVVQPKQVANQVANEVSAEFVQPRQVPKSHLVGGQELEPDGVDDLFNPDSGF